MSVQSGQVTDTLNKAAREGWRVHTINRPIDRGTIIDVLLERKKPSSWGAQP